MLYSSRLALAAARRPWGYGRRLVRHASGSPGKPSSAADAARVDTQQATAVKAVALKSLGIGTSAGVLGSLVGMGGGFVAIPSLTGWLRLTQHQAHGTSLGAVFATGAAGSAAYALSGHVDAPSAAAMAVAGMVAAHVGAQCTTGISPPSLKLALGVLMIAVSPLLPLRAKITSIGKPLQNLYDECTSAIPGGEEHDTATLTAERYEERKGSPDLNQNRSPEGSAERYVDDFLDRTPGVSREPSAERSSEDDPYRMEADGDSSSPVVGCVPSAVGSWRSTVTFVESTIVHFQSTVGSFREEIQPFVSGPTRKSTAVSETAASGNASANQSSEGLSTMVGDGDDGSEGEGIRPRSGKVVKMFAIGLGSGFLAGVFGVGGGVITVPALSLATDLGHKEVLGTSLAAMVLPALVGSVTHFKQGNLIPRIALPLAIGTGVGAFLGGKYAARHLDETSLKWVFSCLMVIMGTRTVVASRAASAASRTAAAAIAKRV